MRSPFEPPWHTFPSGKCSFLIIGRGGAPLIVPLAVLQSSVPWASVIVRTAYGVAAAAHFAAGRSAFPRAESFGVHDLIDPRRTRPALSDWIDWIQPLLREHVGVKRHTIRP